MISSVSIVNVESNDNVIYINNTTVEMINTKFNHNTTSDGNDMFVLKNGELKLTKTEIIENTAINANMLDAENENVVLNKTTLKQNNVGSSLMIENNSKIESNKFATSKPSQLIYVSNGGMTIDTEMNIKSNTALNPSNAIIDVNNNLNIFEGRTFEVTDNAIVSSANNRLIFVNVRNYNIALNAKLIIKNNKVNCMSTAKGNENILSVMYLTSGGFINISTSSIIVKDNASIGDSSTRKENHLYGVYSDNTNGFINQVDGQMRATASYIENIAFNSEDGEGIIYKNFTASNVTGWTSKIL